jgi:hypothetical protein
MDYFDHGAKRKMKQKATKDMKKQRPSKPSSSSFPPIAVCFLFALWVGCFGQSGPPLGKVNGTVKLDGVPVEGAGLEFVADAGGVSYGRTDASGNYYLSFGSSRTGALVGRNVVRITASDRVTVGTKKYESTEIFPKKYNTNSELVVEVARGSNRFDFDCKSSGVTPRQTISSGGN